MKDTRNNMPQHFMEVCRAVCAIVHANINENHLFKQSGPRKRTRISTFSRKTFYDHGVSVRHDEGMIHVKIYVSAVADSCIYHNAIELQRSISEEILMLTSFNPKSIDIKITGIHKIEKKTQ